MSVQQVTFEVTTTSEAIPNWNQPANPPQITVNGNPLPAPAGPPTTASGYQVVVFDQTKDLTQPAAIMSNEYAPLLQDNGSWMDLWPAMYARIVTQLLTSGNPETQIVIVSSYGLDANVPPTNDALAMLFTYGAGPQLQSWETGAVDIGSEGGDWTSFPANYILIGASALGYGEGTEGLEFSAGGQPVKTTASAQFANEAAPS